MAWEHIVFSGIFSGLVGAILWVMQKKGKISKTIAIVIFIVITVGWNLFDFKVLRSNKGFVIDETGFVISKGDESIFLIIKNKDPKLYDEFKQRIIALQKEGRSHDIIYGEVANQIISLTNQRISFAPDKELLSHINIIVKQLEHLQKESAEKCLRFALPEMNKNIYDLLDMEKLFPKALSIQRNKANREMIIASYSERQYQSTIEDYVLALQDLETIMLEMVNQYGEDIALLDSVQSINANQEKGCELLVDINKRFLALPPERAARLYRYMMHQKQ
ncbi:hypothetical protein [Xenorhabdus sp. IM139775]|uniref:hypothetical protein n=1 Tax=Xenorhabdus sp. IM139775 TaxID=3025876 RepID=UPI00235A0E58|nr:hypothetical protein [Xenorhabdus sp. IM139775]MDC9594571.1 hypothetical protein [Xenorhabdus sp. IM139775]